MDLVLKVTAALESAQGYRNCHINVNNKITLMKKKLYFSSDIDLELE